MNLFVANLSSLLREFPMLLKRANTTEEAAQLILTQVFISLIYAESDRTTKWMKIRAQQTKLLRDHAWRDDWRQFVLSRLGVYSNLPTDHEPVFHPTITGVKQSFSMEIDRMSGIKNPKPRQF